ncbi:MAG TPA: polysaccharide biosynthesis/export family protein [Sedimentisphaerales bacterium]|nr:polysaccharide biosynthesis/export family protein [Sedimentisphaerales bacterium]
MKYTWIISVAVLTLIMISQTGCYSSHPEDIEAFLMPDKVDVTAENYVLQPPDEVEVRCSRVPEIDQQRQRIRPDGKISFETLGEIEAAGRTPEQVANILRGKVLELYKLEGEKPIDIRVVTYRSKVFYVLGQVLRPGPQIYTGRDSVLTALAITQLNPMAWQERIQVIRPSKDRNVKPKIFEVHYDRMVAHGDTSKDVLLQEGDIIYVPPTVLAVIAMKIEEVIRPIARAFSGLYTVQRYQYADERYGQ